MTKHAVSPHLLVLSIAGCFVLSCLTVNPVMAAISSEWHLLAEFGSGSLSILIIVFCVMYYRAGGEAPAVLVGLAYLSPTLMAVFLMTILPVVLMAGDIGDLGVFAGSTGALAFSMLMTVGSAFARRPPRGDLGSMIGLTLGVTLLSGAGAAGIMDLLATTYWESEIIHLDASMMASVVAGTGSVATTFLCWKSGGRLNRRISISQGIAAVGHLAAVVGAGNSLFLVFSHVTRILAQMHLFGFMFQETADLMEEQMCLSAQYRTYRRALDSVPIGVLSVNGAGRIETLNRGMQEMFGVSEHELCGRNAFEAGVLVRAGITREDLARVLEPGEERELRITRGDGSENMLSSRTFPVEAGEGTVCGSVTIMRDVTEEKRLEAEIRSSERLAVAGSMARVVSSGLAEPIQRMKREISCLLDGARGEAHRFLSLSLHEVDRLDLLMRDLRLLQTPRKLSLRLVSLGEVARRVLDLSSDGMNRKGATANLKVASRDGVMADRSRIQQVVANMVQNAVEAVEQGGVISVETSVNAGAGTVALEVHNTGDNINEADLSRVFEPFFSTKSSGTGLGLSVCKRIIEDHGGAIHIRNSRGGVVCAIELPGGYPVIPAKH